MSDSSQLDEQIDFHYIDSDQALSASCQRWQSADFIALDTEFIRTDTFYPIAGLLQVGCLGETALIDPLEIADWSPFLDLLRAPSITKVLHSCSEDFEVFLRLFDCVPTPVLDTQIGAALAGMGVGLSYQKLVLAVLDIHLEKGETRSDWLQRPLTDNQQLYAALDVFYLQQIYPMLVARLEELGRTDWWQQEGDLQVASSSPTPPELSYQRLKSLWKLTPRQQLAARMLCEWRETEARRKDVPRGRILKDPICQEVARRMPDTTGALASVKDLSPGVVRRNGDTILSLIAAAKDVPEDELPVLAERPLSREQSQLVKSLRRCCEEVANELALPVEVLTRKRELEAVIRDGELPADVPLWRRQLLTPCLESANSSAGGE
ncbi:ribonuclease D [Spongiibacter nanhainus]|uniref:ribonuclease D n=1 Tax=Spongiibacter nanhainus TaxID=2794344 RepID=UPI001E5424AC|nr:ribonuclease D [Spongiibacter nanhainus]